MLLRATFRLGLVGAKKNVAPEFFDAERFNSGLQLCFHKIRPRPRSRPVIFRGGGRERGRMEICFPK
jgi:hypothetical protein